MQKLIKNGLIQTCEEDLLDKAFDGSLPSSPALVPLAYFLANTDAVLAQSNLGVWIDSDETPEDLAPHTDKLTLIAINFPKFADGRGYSFARILRERFDFVGELRAIGDVLHDQLFYLKRCGFDAFAVREDKDAEAALEGLSDFSENYQADVLQTSPLFRRRKGLA